MKGWVKLHRKLVENELWKSKEPYCERAAWVDMLLRASWSDNETMGLARGEFYFHYRDLASRWGWSKGQVERFVKRLKAGTMIETKSGRKRAVIRVVKYEEYQTLIDESETKSGRNPGQKRDEKRDITKKDLTKKEEDKNTTLTKVRVDRVAFAPRMLMTQNDYDKLYEEYGQLFLEELTKASDWTLAKGKSHKDAAAFMRNWMRRVSAQNRLAESKVRQFKDYKTIELENKAKRERAAAEIAQASIDAWNNVSTVARIGGPKK